MHAKIEVRPFSAREEYAGMIDYFRGGTDSFLTGMGIDLAKVPSRESWLAAVLSDRELPDPEKVRFFVAWCLDGEVVGHSSISHIVHGETAHCHLHLWRSGLRRSGLGSAFLADSIDLFFERFALKTLASEPYAGNPAPGPALLRLGFRWVRRYRTTPTSLASEQEVDRYEISREEWAARGTVQAEKNEP